ncbi:MAG: anti-sigma factor family protein, partial [Thermodesulfobacteriota bacterium]
MNCERFEELLIDFMDNEIEPSDREMVKKHLADCSYCSKKLEEYLEIKRIFNEQSPPQPSTHILATLSKRARQEVAKEKTSFWKRW